MVNLAKFYQSSRFEKMSKREGSDESGEPTKMANLAKFHQSSRFERMREREGSDKRGEILPEFKI